MRGKRGRGNVQISMLSNVCMRRQCPDIYPNLFYICMSCYFVPSCSVLCVIACLSCYSYRKSSKNAAKRMRKMSTVIKMRFSKVSSSEPLGYQATLYAAILMWWANIHKYCALIKPHYIGKLKLSGASVIIMCCLATVHIVLPSNHISPCCCK